ncbi:MAG: phenylalanine--tRNA ligase subunit beta, partial [Leptospira sp.]|nr:phenylalanine--tRNA ligase subunit beta [Leptospira sp.]
VELVLESALFRREDVRKSIRKTGIRSDAAIRYEKGLNSFTCIPVIHRAIQLLRENGNPNIQFGKIAGFNHGLDKKQFIDVSLDFLQKKLGKKVEASEIEDILSRLGFTIENKNPEPNISWKILVPPYRHNYDVTIPEDIVEEIGRTIGYGNIATNALSLALETPIENEIRDWEKKWKLTLAMRLGFHEVFNYSFTSPVDARFECEKKDSELVILKNEMPIDHSVLRTSIYPSLIKNAVTNQDRFEKFGIFEIGRTYDNSKKDADGLPTEDRFIGILFLGEGRSQSEDKSSMESDFVQLRTSVESIFNSWNIKNLTWNPIQRKYFHPNAALELKFQEITIGEMGILHNRETDEYGLRKRPILIKIQLDKFIEAYRQSKKNKVFQAPSSFPQGHLDISLVLDMNDDTNRYVQNILTANIPELEEVWVHDVFRGGNLEENKQSITYRVSLLPKDKTFTQERLKELSDQLLSIAQENGFAVR